MALYLRNIWYVAAYGDEVTRTPLGRTLLDEPLVLYRKRDGGVAVLSDTCPHRFSPMSMGSVVGDDIQCGYHGLRFDAGGNCTANPHSPGALPKAARLRSYPAIDRDGFVWFWPGDPEKADAGLLPDFGYLNDPENFAVVKGYLHVAANYQLVADNLLDLSHAPYLHPHFAMEGVSTEQQLAATVTRLIRDDRSITAYRLRSGLPPNQPTREIFGFGPEPVDTRSHMTWFPPAAMRFDLGSCLAGTAEEDGLCLPAAHVITPETERTSHYFFAQAHNMMRDDPAVGAKLFDMLDVAFRTQDEPMIEAVQRRMGVVSDIMALDPVLLSSDGPPVAARRRLQKLIAAERSEAESITPE